MKRKVTVLCFFILLVLAVSYFLGIGYYTSSSAVSDLKAELESIYGAEYTGKIIDNGTEDMTFVVKPKTWFMTNWNLRNAFNLDYKYECKVIITRHFEGEAKNITTITYHGIDPMGKAQIAERASLIRDSVTEKYEGE